MLQQLKNKISRNPQWKSRIHRLMFCNARPRWWVKHLLNPFVFHHDKGAVIRRQTVVNVSPLNLFHIGRNSTVEEYCVIDNGVGDVIVGHDTRIGLRCTLIGPVHIGNHVILAQNIVVSGLNHRYEDTALPIHQQGVDTRPIHIGDDSWIGANAVITAGVRIGKHVVIGAGSIVTKDIPDFCVAVGNPAKVIKQLTDSNRNIPPPKTQAAPSFNEAACISR